MSQNLVPQNAVSSYHSAKIRVRPAGHKGRGIFAGEPIAAGELILITGGRIVSRTELQETEQEHPFQVEMNYSLAPIDWACLDGIFAINHSCEPNAGIRGQVSLVALRNINKDEEICYDYVMTDSGKGPHATHILNCLCGTPSCRQTVTDMDWRRKDLQAKYRGYFSAYLQKRIEQDQDIFREP